MAKEKRLAKVSKANKVSKTKTSEPQTMEELLSMYGGQRAIFSVGDIVKGKILSIEPGRVIVDIGGKTEGLIAEKTFKEAQDFIKTLKPGDEIEARVIVRETPEGYTILTLRETLEKKAWEKIEKAESSGKPIEVVGVSVNPSGVTVEVQGLTGFIPTSQLGKVVAKNPQSLIGKKFEAIVIDFDKSAKKVVLSEREVSEREELEKARKALKEISEGEVYDGVVTSIYDFGCFVRIEAKLKKEKVPLEGLVHISEMAWERVGRPGDLVSEGDEVKVKVISKEKGKLALSMKQAQEDPWDTIEENYKKDSKKEGCVTKVSDFGVFVQLEPGIEGLIHITKIPPGTKLAKGDKVNVYIEEVDVKERRMSLGLVLTEKPVGYK